GQQFIGTTNTNDFVMATNGVEHARLTYSATQPSFRLTAASNTATQLELQNPAGTFASTIKAGAQTGDINYTLPAAAPTANQMLAATAVTGTNVTLGWSNGTGTNWALTG